MSRFRIGIVWSLVMMLAALPAVADWGPGDGYKMHEPQYPNEHGWNVYASEGTMLADDWMCTESGTIDDIHFWGSWIDGNPGTINGFTISIYADVPADPQDPTSYSRPGTLLWGPRYFTDYLEVAITPDPQAWEGWYNPLDGSILPNNHDNYLQYNIVDIVEPFVQEEGTIYWLAITADVEPEATPKTWGWKSSIIHWNDDAVIQELDWVELYEPDLSFVANPFNVQVDLGGGLVDGFGEYAFADSWFYYTDDAEPWWNIWFYDHPLSVERWKEVYVTGIARALDPMQGPGQLTIAVNWTTPAWSVTGNPPGEPRRPPMDEDLDPLQPGQFLMRQVIWSGPVTEIPVDIGELGFTIQDYNPEWVSIDVQGWNFTLDGVINHACVGTEPQSMDLSFVVNGHPIPTGACCFDDGSCTGDMTAADCIAAGGSYGGDGTACAGTDNDQNGVDDFCDGVVTLGACCYGLPTSPTCVNTTQTICGQTFSGTYHTGQDCATFTCPTPAVGACCLSDGSCLDVTASACSLVGGAYQGDGTVCLGDGDQNGVDDACETGERIKWEQLPDLTPNGMDVMCTETKLLADDFLCTETGRIGGVEIWGSWYNDVLPIDPGAVDFVLSLHNDVPSTSGIVYPAMCPYVTIQTPLVIYEGLPPGSELLLDARLDDYMNIMHSPGGDLGGQIVLFDATLYLEITGTGMLAGYVRALAVPVAVEIHLALPDNPGGNVQFFAMSLSSLAGEIFGDPDFDLLRIHSGSQFGLPSPGETTLTKLPDGDFQVDSFFDITYDIEFVGAPGSILDGFTGVSPGTAIITQVEWPSYGHCITADVGTPSHPGDLLCLMPFPSGSFTWEEVVEPGLEEGWFDPDPLEPIYIFPGDHNCYKYSFVLDDECWTQEGTPEQPLVYWLDVQAYPQGAAEPAYFGWKSSAEHWNDDAVWAMGTEPDIVLPWHELWYPYGHQFYGQSTDLAFRILGPEDQTGCCVDPMRGDANNSGDNRPTIGDISVMIDAKFITGNCGELVVPPLDLIPCKTEADVNESGVPNHETCDDITIGDISLVIDYLFITGPENWDQGYGVGMLAPCP